MPPKCGRSAFLSFFSWGHGYGWTAGPLRCRRNPNTTWPCARGLVPGASWHLPGPRRARGGVLWRRLARWCSVPKHGYHVSVFPPVWRRVSCIREHTFGCCNSDCLRRWPLVPCVPEAGCRCWNSGTKLYQESSYILGVEGGLDAACCQCTTVGGQSGPAKGTPHAPASGVAAGSSAESAEWSPECGTAALEVEKRDAKPSGVVPPFGQERPYIQEWIENAFIPFSQEEEEEK